MRVRLIVSHVHDKGRRDALIAPQIPPMPRRIRKPYLLLVTNEVTRLMIPKAAKPPSKTS